MRRDRAAIAGISILLLSLANASVHAASANAQRSQASPPMQTPPGQSNVLTATVWTGPYGNYINGPFTHVTICQPGTDSCQTIGGILIDTGSSGLRIFNQAKRLTLPSVTTAKGEPIAECVAFGTLSTWGRVAFADVKLGGEPTIPSMPIQVINAGYGVVPAICRSGPPLALSPGQIGYNGILGVGLWGADCGGACATLGPQNPSMYFACGPLGCRLTPMAEAAQVQNPVALLPEDNDGVVLKLPLIPFLGAPSVSGKLVLGINTRGNNKLGDASIFLADDLGNIATTFNNRTIDGFVDSGSNALFFNASIPQCDPTLAAGFYCPSDLMVLGAINTGRNGSATGPVAFSVANAVGLAATGNKAFYDVAGTFGAPFFDFGLPFFYGRNVYTGIDGVTTPGATAGPYFAY